MSWEGIGWPGVEGTAASMIGLVSCGVGTINGKVTDGAPAGEPAAGPVDGAPPKTGDGVLSKPGKGRLPNPGNGVLL